GPATSTGTGKPSTVTIVEGIWPRYRAAAVGGRFLRGSQSVIQPSLRRSDCLPLTSRNVCGSEPLTAIAGFGVGNAMPKAAILSTFSNEKYTLLFFPLRFIVCSYTSASGRGVGSRVVVIGMPSDDGSKKV